MNDILNPPPKRQAIKQQTKHTHTHRNKQRATSKIIQQQKQQRKVHTHITKPKTKQKKTRQENKQKQTTTTTKQTNKNKDKKLQLLLCVLTSKHYTMIIASVSCCNCSLDQSVSRLIMANSAHVLLSKQCNTVDCIVSCTRNPVKKG